MIHSSSKILNSIVLLGAITVSVTVGIVHQPTLEKESNLISIVVTIVSILSGILIAVMVFVTKPVIKYARDGRELQMMKESVKKAFFRLKVMFLLFILTLCLAVLIYVVPDKYRWIVEKFFVSIAFLDLIISFALPFSLASIHMEMYQSKIDEYKPDIVKEAEEKRNQKKGD